MACSLATAEGFAGTAERLAGSAKAVASATSARSARRALAASGLPHKLHVDLHPVKFLSRCAIALVSVILFFAVLELATAITGFE
jgi:hypothetical protein